jgi:hypothetical protein
LKFPKAAFIHDVVRQGPGIWSQGILWSFIVILPWFAALVTLVQKRQLVAGWADWQSAVVQKTTEACARELIA